MPNDDGGERLAPRLVLGVEAPEIGAVEVKYAHHTPIAPQRDDKFGPGGRIASDMTGKFVYIPDQDRPSLARGGPAHAAP
jgi:hypothetical protein